jgi:hypothetical protein
MNDARRFSRQIITRVFENTKAGAITAPAFPDL